MCCFSSHRWYQASAIAEVLITHDSGVPTLNLPGFRTYTVTATSTVPGEAIHVVDFIGDPDNNNPATARGFFGPMNQVLASGMPAVFDANINPFDEIPPPEPSLHDSHFLILDAMRSGINVTIPAPFFKESTGSLRAIYAGDVALGQSIEFAQLVIPIAASATVRYRGSFAIAQGGTIVDTPDIVGSIVPVPEPASLCLLLMGLIAGGYRRIKRLEI